MEIAIHLVVREPQNVVALTGERCGTHCVAGGLFVGRMGGSVDFNDYSGVEAGEVRDIPAKDDLAPESEARDLFAPQALPEAALGAGRIASERPGKRRRWVDGQPPP